MAKKKRGFDYDGYRKAINKAAFKQGVWAGVPVPVDGMEMVIAPGYPYADIFKKKPEDTTDTVVNSWFCSKLRTRVGSIRDAQGKYHVGVIDQNNAATALFTTLQAAATWDIEAEIRAMNKLESLIPEHMFDAYCLTGTFLESSKRSGVMYWFRRLRPTVAASMSGKKWSWRSREAKECTVKFLCALCLHPIGYYKDSWAGAMVPTDDVIAHLLLMRADEKFFWRKSNQIPCYQPEAGIF